MLRLFMLIALSCPASYALAQETGSALPYISVYEHDRSEQLVARGLLQMEARDYRTAEKTFLEAVQVAKVNYGCTYPLIVEYDASANVDDGSCAAQAVQGSTE